MWMRFLPAIEEVRRLVAEGAIGELVSVTCDLSQRARLNPRSRMFAPDLGGGALLDMGVYGLSFAMMLLGRPERVRALSTPTETGVDEAQRHTTRMAGSGLRFEAVEVDHCVRSGLRESARRPLADTIAVMEVLDEVRRQIGLRFPMEADT
jgi:predicted dehydrogenase